MTQAAPRLDPRLLALLAKPPFARRRTIADLHRLLGEAASELDLPRPSYEQTRVHVHAIRADAEARLETAVELRWDRYQGLATKQSSSGDRPA